MGEVFYLNGDEVVTYDQKKDILIIDRSLKVGIFNFYIRGMTYHNESVLYPIVLKLNQFTNSAPKFDDALVPFEVNVY